MLDTDDVNFFRLGLILLVTACSVCLLVSVFTVLIYLMVIGESGGKREVVFFPF